MDNLNLKMRDAKELAGTPKWFRAIEVGSILTFWSLVGAVIWKVKPHFHDSPWLVLSGFLTGFIMADWVSGLVHWLADTWGSVEMPVIGKSLLRPFREHHVDQKAMTHHDYIETNGSNCMISVPWALGAFLIPINAGPYHWFSLFNVVWITSMIFWVMMTNQFHKWAHMDDGRAPKIVTALQKMHLILPPAHHHLHHTAPFDKYYCITTGWLNWPLTKLGFFKGLERLVTATTGIIPRKDDIGIDAAIAIAPGINDGGGVVQAKGEEV